RSGPGGISRARVEYSYDAMGRISKMLTHQGALTKTIRYGYSGPIDSHSYTADFAGAIESANWSGPTGLIATASTSGQESKIAYHYFDHRGDTRAIADGAGNVGFEANYSEYGEITSQNSQLPQYGFVGAHKRITNPATGLIHMGARMYQPKFGRFLSRDPITGGSANDYEYTSGDPINRLDPSGTADCMVVLFVVVCSSEEDGAVVAGPGGIITGQIRPGRPPKIDSYPYPNRGNPTAAPPTAGRGGIDWPGGPGGSSSRAIVVAVSIRRSLLCGFARHGGRLMLFWGRTGTWGGVALSVVGLFTPIKAVAVAGIAVGVGGQAAYYMHDRGKEWHTANCR
ncbi:MAG: hypothetical protein DCC49_13550, partial [Acidobacteria bacterium]